jgi:hypothetical protein
MQNANYFEAGRFQLLVQRIKHVISVPQRISGESSSIISWAFHSPKTKYPVGADWPEVARLAMRNNREKKKIFTGE